MPDHEPPERRKLREALTDPDSVIEIGPGGEYLGSRRAGLVELDRLGAQQTTANGGIPCRFPRCDCNMNRPWPDCCEGMADDDG